MVNGTTTRTKWASTTQTLALAWLIAMIVAALHAEQARASGIIGIERSTVGHINAHRRAHGLRPLRISAKLSRVAVWMGRDMAHRGYFSHTDSLGRDPFARMSNFGIGGQVTRGENLAAGQRSATQAFAAWRGSPGHNYNMLLPQFRKVGIALIRAPHSQYGWYWVTEFSS